MPYVVGYEHLITFVDRHRRADGVVEIRRRQEGTGPAHAAMRAGGRSACGDVVIGYLTTQPWPLRSNTCLRCLDLVPPGHDLATYLGFANDELRHT